jgi:hypothetical protein
MFCSLKAESQSLKPIKDECGNFRYAYYTVFEHEGTQPMNTESGIITIPADGEYAITINQQAPTTATPSTPIDEEEEKFLCLVIVDAVRFANQNFFPSPL